MRWCEPGANIPDAARGAAVALGKFDGVHLGHQAVVQAAARAANARGAPLAAAVFEPSPQRYFAPAAPPSRLQNPDQRARALAALGVEFLFELRFDANLAAMSDAAFARDVLAERFGARHVSVGTNFQFGRDRMGDAASLTRLGAQYGFSVQAIEPIAHGAARVSSTAIRNAVASGEMDKAAAMLTRPWAIEGVVQRGFARGRDFGFPTANIALGEYQRPRLGVYAVHVQLDAGAARAGVASVGVNPSVGALPAPLLEAHVFDFEGDLYGRAIEVQLIAFLRAERRFDDIEGLKAQMRLDEAEARALLSA